MRRASLDVGGGMHNATYQQVYQQAYQHVRVQPQQLYQASSLYATSSDGNPGRQASMGGHSAGTDQACCCPVLMLARPSSMLLLTCSADV